jgi:hypothetical protein
MDHFAHAQIELEIADGKITKEEGERRLAELGPRSLGGDHRVKLGGCFLYGDPAVNGVQKIKLLYVPGSPHPYVAIFTTIEKLEIFCKEFGESHTGIKTVNDAVGFFDECAVAGVRIMVDPYRHANGRIRWIEAECFEGAS